MKIFDEIIDRKGTYCTQWDYVQDRFGEKSLLPFTISDTDFIVPESVSKAIQKRIEHPVYGYTRWNHEDFKNVVEFWFLKNFHLQIKKDWIIYSPSVIYSISQLIQIKSNIGEGVIVQTPAYDAFFKTIYANNRELIDNQLIYQDGKYTIDFMDLESKMSDPNNKIMLLCSPHNPTGRVWNDHELNRIVKLCEKYDVFLISDEIHMDITRKRIEHKNILKYRRENVALLSSGTKTFNFPGLIFSYLLIPDDALRKEFNICLKNKDGLSSCSTLGLEATIAAYQNERKWVEDLNQYIDSNIQFVREYLQTNLPKISLIEPEATYLLWLDVSKLQLSMEVIQEYCINVGKIAIMEGNIYGGNGSRFLRLNIGCSKFKLKDGLKKLKQSIDAAMIEVK
jgi:cystathionine beta-lyase